MNAGKWITVAFVLFAGFIATLVTICMRQDISLVSKDYYKDELAYQEQIQRLDNTSALEEKAVVKIVNNQLMVQLPDSKETLNGELKLFCPSNAKMDRNFKLKPSEETIQIFDMDALQKGMYRVQLRWDMEGKEFYQEEVINY